MSNYAAPHVWNLVAKTLRESEPTSSEEDSFLLHISLRFAERFNKEDIGFDALKFLDQCSPDSERPFSESWEEV